MPNTIFYLAPSKQAPRRWSFTSEEASINYPPCSRALVQRRAISRGIRTGEPAALLPKFFLPQPRRQIDRSPYDPWSRAVAGDTSRDLMDSTAILSYERTNCVIKDKINDCGLACPHATSFKFAARNFRASKDRKLFIRGYFLEDMYRTEERSPCGKCDA